MSRKSSRKGKSEGTTRRSFLRTAALAGAGFYVAGSTGCGLLRPSARYRSPNEKLNIACIGAGGRGGANVVGVGGENIVALCDVDDKRAAGSYERFPKAKRFHDYRRMFDAMHKTIDAVVISVPDHSHALPAVMAMEQGMHVYCEKPLTHDVWEARLLNETAKKYGVATQMGNQGTSADGLRRGVEAIRSGVIGKVREAHVWTNRPVWPQGMDRPTEVEEIPAHIKWDLFLGTAPARPFNKAYHPFKWRGWWDFGTGALGDMGCHTANMAFMALELGSPVSAQAKNSKFSRDSFPTWSVINLDFPARGDLPPVRWNWYDGSNQKPAWVNEKLGSLIPGEEVSGSGSILVGDKGVLYSPNDYGVAWKLLPEEKFRDWTPPEPTLPKSPGHHAEWIAACKGGDAAMSNFSYAGPLTETLLLGNVAMYTGSRIFWDGPACRVTNSEAANALIRRSYREGWRQI
jgi:predicted dehydrogenase